MRREYLYRKSLEGKERDEYERKRKIRTALEGMVPCGLPLDYIAYQCLSFATYPTCLHVKLLRPSTDNPVLTSKCAFNHAVMVLT